MEFMTMVFCYVISWSLRVTRSCDVVPGEASAQTEGGPSKGLEATKRKFCHNDRTLCRKILLKLKVNNPKEYGKFGTTTCKCGFSMCLHILCQWVA
jgi:hypothetical protein